MKNYSRIGLLVSILAGIAFIAASIYSFNRVARPDAEPLVELNILTYSSFGYSLGPGPSIAKAFQKTCNCRVKFKLVDEAALLLQRLRLKPEEVDLVIGLDQFALPEAEKMAWQEVSVSEFIFPEVVQGQNYETFVPYNWSPMSFIYRQDKAPTFSSLQKLLDSSEKDILVIQDPRTSTPGLQFLAWLYILSDEDLAKFELNLSLLKPKVKQVFPTWSNAYGFFQKENVDMVFSYFSSLIYHYSEEKDKSYSVLNDEKGHIFQVEHLAVPATCKSCQLAKSFARFMLSDQAQNYLVNKNFMFPVIENPNTIGEFESVLADIPKATSIDPEASLRAYSKKDQLIEIWKQVFND